MVHRQGAGIAQDVRHEAPRRRQRAAGACQNIPRRLRGKLYKDIKRSFLLKLIILQLCLRNHPKDWTKSEIANALTSCLPPKIPDLPVALPGSSCDPHGSDRAQCGPGGACRQDSYELCPPFLPCVRLPLPGLYHCRKVEVTSTERTNNGRLALPTGSREQLQFSVLKTCFII